MEEIWKDVAGYEGLYQVSTFGRVKSLMFRNNVVYKKREIPKILKLTLHSNKNYSLYQVYLCKNGNKKQFKVHRMVAETFIQNPHNKPEVNHIDSNPHNNNVANLEWCTRSENVLHASEYGNFGATLYDIDICQYYSTHSMKDTEKKFKTSRPRIIRILKRNNIVPRSLSEGQIIHKKHSKDDLIKLYLDGYSIAEIRNITKYSTTYVSNVLKLNNIKIRSYRDTMRLKRVRYESQ